MLPPSIPPAPSPPQPLPPAVPFPDPFASAAASPSLLAVVVHELRAPLRSMLAGAEVLLEQGDTLDPSTVRHLLSAIRHSTLGLVELVENLLCASSLQAG